MLVEFCKSLLHSISLVCVWVGRPPVIDQSSTMKGATEVDRNTRIPSLSLFFFSLPFCVCPCVCSEAIGAGGHYQGWIITNET